MSLYHQLYQSYKNPLTIFCISHVTHNLYILSEYITNASDICVAAFVSSFWLITTCLPPAASLPRLAYCLCLVGKVLPLLLYWGCQEGGLGDFYKMRTNNFTQ